MSGTKREGSYEEKERIGSPTSGTAEQGARIEDTIYNADLKAAIDNTQLDPWSRRAISLYFICMVGFLNAVSSGMPSLCAACVCRLPDHRIHRFRWLTYGWHQCHGTIPPVFPLQGGRREHGYQ